MTTKDNIYKKNYKVLVLGMRGFPHVQGGIEKHCEELYPRLSELGCDVTAITRVTYMPREQRLRTWRGIKFIHIWVPKNKYLEAIAHTFMGIIIARFHSPDILHIHAIGPSILVPFAKMFRLKVVMTNHGTDYNRQKWNSFAKVILRIGEFMGAKFADRVIVISQVIKNIMEHKYCRNDLEFIPNGVTLPKIIPAGSILKEFNLEPKKYVFIACRFVPEKGLHDLIVAFQKINEPKFKLVITGDADHESEYSRSIRKSAENNENIILTGFLYGKPLQELYSNAGLFVLPSYYEGLPIALLEAMSYDLPVLVSDIPQHKEIGLPEFRYYALGDTELLSQKLQELYRYGISTDEKLKQRQALQEYYNWDKIAQATLKVYKAVIKSKTSEFRQV